MKNVFVGRKNFREEFWSQYGKMQSNKPIVLNYYGAGGVGKSSLLDQLVHEIDHKKLSYGSIFRDVHVLYYDFANGIDKRKILNQWKAELAKVNAEFPYFETGDFFLSLKQGARNVNRPRMKSWLENNKFIKDVTEIVEDSDPVSDASVPLVNALGIEMNDNLIDALNVFPGVRTLAALLRLVNNALARRKTDRQLKSHADVKAELDRRAAERNSNVLGEFLPILFAQDVLDRLGNKKLIIFLDTYEQLVSEGSGGKQLSGNNVYRDDWLFNSADGLVALIPNAMWVIAGRDKINRTLIGESNQHLLTGFDRADANNFLMESGVGDQPYRDEIINLSGGYPIFLEECVKSLRKAAVKLPIDVLDKRCRKKVVNRLMKNISGDSAAMSMIQELCILSAWTNDMVLHDKVIPHENPNTYKKIKNLSFVRAKVETIDGGEQIVFRLDETLQQLLFDFIKRDEDLCGSIEYMIEAMDRSASKFADKNRAEGEMRLRRRIVELAQEIYPLPQKISVAIDCMTAAKFDIDAAAFLLRADGRVAGDDDFIFYNQPTHGSECITLDGKSFSIEPAKIPVAVDKISFTLTVDGDHSFDQVSSVKLRLIDESNGDEILHFDFGENLTVETAIVIGELQRQKDRWKFNALGAGSEGGLAALCRKFGVEIE